MRIYAGIGSRKTPANVCSIMTDCAATLSKEGWLLRSGHADGADQAFEDGARWNAEIHLPWYGYNPHSNYAKKRLVPQIIPEIEDIAAKHHPAWQRLSQGVQKMMCRNVTIILGTKLNQHAEIVICWTPGARLEGGTAHGIRIANTFGIPVYNIADPKQATALDEYLGWR